MLSDIPVAFKWQSSGQWTSRVCKSGFKKLRNGTEGGLGSITPSVPPPDTPVTFKWQSSGSWVKFYRLCVIILSDIPVTIQWQSSQTTIHEWHPSDSWVTLEWQFCRWTVTRMSLGCHSNLWHQLTFQWHSSDSPVEVECHLSVTWICLFVFCLFICLFVCSGDIQVTFKWHSVTFEWHSSGTWVALYW